MLNKNTYFGPENCIFLQTDTSLNTLTSRGYQNKPPADPKTADRPQEPPTGLQEASKTLPKAALDGIIA